MSFFHCACGFAIDDLDEYGDHLGEVFERPDDKGVDGLTHLELADTSQGRFVCPCGFAADDASDLDDHLLVMLITPGCIGADGKRHVLVDPSTPDRYYPKKAGDEQ